MLERIKKHYKRSRMIRNATDTYSDGICFAASDGRPILANKKINEVCYELTGHTITNGQSMWLELMEHAIPEENVKSQSGLILCRLSDGTVWQFQKRQLEVETAQVIQYVASDITELYEYGNRLLENNLRVAELHERQRELLKNIVQNNVDQELLSAKMRIHDNFGRVLIMTKQALFEHDRENDGEDIFLAWQNVITDMENASLILEPKETLPQNELVQVADLIGCKVEFQGKQPVERKALLLLYAAIREALTNAVRHAGANQLTIIIEDKKEKYHVRILNNGNRNVSSIKEGSGLTNLRKRLEQEGATLQYGFSQGVELILTIPKE